MKINIESDFYNQSREIVCEFLQTAVIVDDKVRYPDWFDQPGNLLITPGRHTETPELSEDNNIDNLDLLERSDGKVLELQKVINGFAEKGIICSIFQPTADKEYTKKNVTSLANNSDALILDWQLEKEDSGALALEILSEIIVKTESKPEQLRLIIIFTGTQEIHQVSENIIEHLGDKASRVDDYTIDIGATRISIYIKPNTPVIQEDKERLVSFENLVDKVIDEFTQMNMGLIPNTVLKALSALRKNTNKILETFSNNLDLPFLSHRILLSPLDKESSEELIVKLISEEFQSILDESNVKSCVNIVSIKDYLGNLEIQSRDINLTYNQENLTIHIDTVDKVISLLTEGIEPLIEHEHKEDYLINFNRNAHKKKLIKLFGDFNNEKEKYLNNSFSYLSSTRTHYSDSLPSLTLGTILKSETNHQEIYLVCIMPRCDCVRILEARIFPFLPLNISGGQFDTIIKHADKFITLLSEKKPYKVKHIEFPYDETDKGIILAKSDKDGRRIFQDTNGNQYVWICELKWAQGQRFIQKFANNLSRVGLDESEWLRRHSGR